MAFGPSTALGTDGIGADMLAELQAGWFRGQEAGVDWSPGRWLQALVAGAQLSGEALGVTLGRIEQGAAADLVVLDPPVGPPLSADSVATNLIFRLSSAAIQHVLVGGSWRLWHGAVVDVDTAALQARAEAAARSTWARMDG